MRPHDEPCLVHYNGNRIKKDSSVPLTDGENTGIKVAVNGNRNFTLPRFLQVISDVYTWRRTAKDLSWRDLDWTRSYTYESVSR